MSLLVAVTAGLFAMHTVGHAGMPGGPPMHQPGMAFEPTHPAADHMGPLRAISVDLGAPRSPGTPMGLLALCLAILGGITLLVMISLLARRRHPWRRLPDGRPSWFTIAVRGPPGPRRGLILADRSVLRN